MVLVLVLVLLRLFVAQTTDKQQEVRKVSISQTRWLHTVHFVLYGKYMTIVSIVLSSARTNSTQSGLWIHNFGISLKVMVCC